MLGWLKCFLKGEHDIITYYGRMTICRRCGVLGHVEKRRWVIKEVWPGE